MYRVGLLSGCIVLLAWFASPLSGQVARPAGVTATSCAAAGIVRPSHGHVLAVRQEGRSAGLVGRVPRRRAVVGAVVGGVVGGATGFAWVKSRSHQNRELDGIPVFYGAAFGALVGFLVGTFTTG
jgi:hypothetical protein